HHQADHADQQDQHGDGPVQQLADAAPAVGVLQAHGWTGSSGSGGRSGGRGDGGGGTPASAGGSAAPAWPGSGARLLRTASASIRSSTSSPIIVGQASTPNALRLSVPRAENPAVRRNGGMGWRRSALKLTSSASGRVTPRRVSWPWTTKRSGPRGSTRSETKCASGQRPASSRLRARVARFQSGSPR